MENLKEFLDTSTIHGLSWISSTKRISRVFWTIVVISGFTTAIVMILQSFDNWKDQPITTTIETLRLSKLTLPNITICPPKHTATNLNFDIMEADKMVLSKESRKEILDYAIEVYQEDNHKEVMKNLSQIHEEDRGFNWYHGYSKMGLPYSPNCYRRSSIDFCTNQLVYSIYTSQSSGYISTINFGENYTKNEMEENILCSVYIYIPRDINDDGNVTLFLKVEKKSYLQGFDQFSYNYVSEEGMLDANITFYTKSITGPSTEYIFGGRTHYANFFNFKLDRIVSKKDIENIKLQLMPGFKIRWYFEPLIEPKGCLPKKQAYMAYKSRLNIRAKVY